VIQDNPTSALSTSSRLWLQLIEREEAKLIIAKDPHHTMVSLMAQVVRDWMNLKLNEHRRQKTPRAMETQNRTGESSEVVQTLQKQVRERDRRIAILQSQMEDLKLIDQDYESRKRSLKLPSVLP
jgi:DNA helicase IV